jgi:L-arabinokinase
MIQSNWPDDLRHFVTNLKKNLGGLFTPSREIYIARAPARLDVMAGMSDYAGATVLQSLLKEGTIVAVQKRIDRRFLVRNLNMNSERVLNFEFRLDDLLEGGKPRSYASLQHYWAQDKSTWLSNLLGAIPVLLQEGFVPKWETGANIAVYSTIPQGTAVAACAALQIAHLLALKSAFGISLDGFQMTLCCQILENQIVGRPAGITRYIAVSHGQKGRTLVLRCQPHELLNQMALPAGLQWVGINSGITLAQRDSRYRDVRIASFMGRRILFQQALKTETEEPFGGYLCNVEPDEWEKKYRKSVLAKITGDSFRERWQTHEDPATLIDGSKRYSPRSVTEHHILEQQRSYRLVEILSKASANDRQVATAAGQILFESHASLNERCNLGCREVDLLVELIKAQGPEKGLYGARVSGWGSGGTVAVLAAAGTEDLLRNLARQYQDRTGLDPFIFFGSSQGALELGTIRVAFD